MRNHIIWLIVGLLIFALFMLSLRGCNDQNTPWWLLDRFGKPEMALQNETSMPSDNAFVTVAPQNTPAASAEAMEPTLPAATSVATEAMPDATPAATEEPASPVMDETAMVSEQTPEQAAPIPGPASTMPEAAPMPADTTVMASDTAELSDGAEALSRDLYMTKPYMRGNDVKKVQRALKDRGFDVGPVDGVFGNRTQRAIMTYQSFHEIHDNGDPNYGRVDQETWNWLF